MALHIAKSHYLNTRSKAVLFRIIGLFKRYFRLDLIEDDYRSRFLVFIGVCGGKTLLP